MAMGLNLTTDAGAAPGQRHGEAGGQVWIPTTIATAASAMSPRRSAIPARTAVC